MTSTLKALALASLVGPTLAAAPLLAGHGGGGHGGGGHHFGGGGFHMPHHSAPMHHSSWSHQPAFAPSHHHLPSVQPAHHHVAPQPTQRTVRPSVRPSIRPNLAAVRPTQRPQATVRPISRVPNRTTVAATSRKPLNTKLPTRLSNTTRQLSQATNTVLAGLTGLPPAAQSGVQAALAGRLLTNGQVAALQQELKDPSLTAPQRAAIAAALQNNADQRRGLAAAAAIAQALGRNGGNGGGGNGGGDTGGDGGGFPGGGFIPGDDGGDVAAAPAFVPAAPADSPSVVAGGPEEVVPETGLRITWMDETGPAATQGLQVGDVIVQLAGMPTHNYDDVRLALQQAGDTAEVVFLNVENGQLESMTVQPVATRLGISVEEVQID